MCSKCNWWVVKSQESVSEHMELYIISEQTSSWRFYTHRWHSCSWIYFTFVCLCFYTPLTLWPMIILAQSSEQGQTWSLLHHPHLNRLCFKSQFTLILISLLHVSSFIVLKENDLLHLWNIFPFSLMSLGSLGLLVNVKRLFCRCWTCECGHVELHEPCKQLLCFYRHLLCHSLMCQ